MAPLSILTITDSVISIFSNVYNLLSKDKKIIPEIQSELDSAQNFLNNYYELRNPKSFFSLFELTQLTKTAILSEWSTYKLCIDNKTFSDLVSFENETIKFPVFDSVEDYSYGYFDISFRGNYIERAVFIFKSEILVNDEENIKVLIDEIKLTVNKKIIVDFFPSETYLDEKNFKKIKNNLKEVFEI